MCTRGTLLSSNRGEVLVRSHPRRLRLYRARSPSVAGESRFVARHKDIVGLYLSPSLRVMVLRCDEKGQQYPRGAPDRRLDHDGAATLIESHGGQATATLLAALEVLDRKVISQCHPRYRQGEWPQLLRLIGRGMPKQKSLQLLTDNWRARDLAEVQKWLGAHPGNKLRILHTTRPWLHAVKGFFRTIDLERLPDRAFASAPALVAAITNSLVHGIVNPHPFIWIKGSSPFASEPRTFRANPGFGSMSSSMRRQQANPECGVDDRSADPTTARERIEHTAFELTENIPIGTYTLVLPPGGTIPHFHFMSKRFVELSGVDREALARDAMVGFSALHPEDYERWLNLNLQAVASKQAFRGEARFISRGQIRWIAAESIPRALPDGSTVWEGVTVDITPQKEAEAQARLANERLVVVEREHARLAERRRLLQDMHDGFGSQLATARLRLLEDDLTQPQLEEILLECLDDFHLVIDTLNSPDIGFEDALIDYRHRMRQRLAQLPVAIDWELALDGCRPLDERVILQILRILQEALANALKHARPAHILVAARCDSNSDVQIIVADDGTGMPTTIEHGCGLHNMRSRARDIGASLNWELGCPGTRFVLKLPSRGS